MRALAVALATTLLPALALADDDLEVPSANVAPPAPSASGVKAPAPPVATSAKPVDVAPAKPVEGPGGFVVSGYVQAEFQRSQASEDERAQGGSPLNLDRFLVRRGRLRVDRSWGFATAALEFDGSTTRGAFFGVRRAEASLVLEGHDGAPPPLVLTAGLTEVPFGHELVESSRTRFFLERSTASLAFFPGEPDLGVRLHGALGFFRYAVALTNGDPVDDRAGRTVREFNAAKDLVGRLGFVAAPAPALTVQGGVSFLRGTGFHPGTDAVKGGVEWRDLNENGQIDAGETRAKPDQAATPSVNFDRWAVGVDLLASLTTVLGESRLYGEVYVASNLDRGVFFADPIANSGDLRHFGFYVGALQAIGKYAFVGLRLDRYDPNADFLDKRGGKLVPTDQAITTLSPLVGVHVPGRFRLSLQYDRVRDHLARDVRGVPVDLKNDLLTARLQVEL